jgi:Domain of unknown function (DUF4037)
MAFVPGVKLAGRFYAEAVRPILDREFPGLPHAAALIGPGSEVLGFDTVRSTDHDWGPRVQLFVSPDHRPQLSDLLAELPETFAGWPRVRPVELLDLGDFCTGRLGFDPRRGVSTDDWLTTPSQRLAEMTAGAVFHDDTGELTAVREALHWYPDEIWRFVLAGQWQRIGQEEPFVGRCGEVGDDLGSAVVAARLARDVMRLCLLMERRYPPYSKWLGTAFARLPGIGLVHEGLTTAVRAERWTQRQAGLCQAYEAVAARHNDLRLTPPLDPTVRPFYDRPFLVLDAGRFAAALRSTIADPALRSLPLIGAVDQVVDNTDVLERPSLSRNR